MPRLSALLGPQYRQVFLHCLLALATAGLLLLALPKFDFRWLAPFALTPLLIALARTPDGWRLTFSKTVLQRSSTDAEAPAAVSRVSKPGAAL